MRILSLTPSVKPHRFKVSIVLFCHVLLSLSHVCHGSKQSLHPDFYVLARTPLGVSFEDAEVMENSSFSCVTYGGFIFGLKQCVLKQLLWS